MVSIVVTLIEVIMRLSLLVIRGVHTRQGVGVLVNNCVLIRLVPYELANLRTDVGCHSPSPLGVGMFLEFRWSAIIW